MWPGVLIGATLANAWVFSVNAGGKPAVEILAASLWIGLGNTLEAVAAAALIVRLIGRNVFPVHTVEGSLKFLAICPLACLVSSVGGTLTLWLWALPPDASFVQIWFTWWLGDFSGMFTVAPAIMACCFRPPVGGGGGGREGGEEWWQWGQVRRILEAIALFGLLMGLCALIFGGTLSYTYVVSLPYMVMPMIIWVAFRFNRRGLPMAILVVTGFAMWGACQELGPFHRTELNHSLLQVQLFNSVLAMMGTLLAAAVRERLDSLDALNALNCTLEQRVAERTTELQALNKKLMKSQEAAWAASQAKSQFLASMSHEIRTPIHGILGMTDLTLDSQISHQQREQLETVTQSANHLLMIVNDILDISKIEAGKLELDEEAFAVRSVVAGTMRMLSARAQQKMLTWQWNVDAEVPDTVLGDPARLRQCLVNLVGNAVKFTSEGFVKVEVTIETTEGVATKLPPFWRIESEMDSKSTILKDVSHCSSESPDSEVVLLFAVTDTGIGVPEDKLQLIFRSFEQADASMTRMYGGTGLGLSITSRLVAMMGGQIWVESRVDKGSTFYFSAKFRQSLPTSMVRSVSQGSPRRLDRCPSAPARLPTGGNSALSAAAAIAVGAVDSEKSTLENTKSQENKEHLGNTNLQNEEHMGDTNSQERKEHLENRDCSEKKLETLSKVASKGNDESTSVSRCCVSLSDAGTGDRQNRDRKTAGQGGAQRRKVRELVTYGQDSVAQNLVAGASSGNQNHTSKQVAPERQNGTARHLFSQSLDLSVDTSPKSKGTAGVPNAGEVNVGGESLDEQESSKTVKSEKGMMRGLNYRFGLSRRPRSEEQRAVKPSSTPGKGENSPSEISSPVEVVNDVGAIKVKRNLLRSLRRLPPKLTAKEPGVSDIESLAKMQRTSSSPGTFLDLHLSPPEKRAPVERTSSLPPIEKPVSRLKQSSRRSSLSDSSEIRLSFLPEISTQAVPSYAVHSISEPYPELHSSTEAWSKEKPQRALSLPVPSQSKKTSENRFLLADDSPVNQMVACRYLRKSGLEVDAVGDGAQVLQKLEELPGLYILLLLDVQMPVMDGIETVKAIRKKERDENLPHLPVIGLTAHAANTFREKCISAGMDAYLSKPFSMDQLLGAIQGTLVQFGRSLPEKK